MLVRKNWKEIIEVACKWKIVMPLYKSVCPKNQGLLQFLQTTNRTFFEIRVIDLACTDLVVEIFRRHGPNVLKLSVSSATINNSDDFVKIIACMPNLEHLILQNVDVENIATGGECTMPELAKLKILEATSSPWNASTYFKSSPNIIRHKTALELLQSQRQLKSLLLTDIGNTSALLQPGVITNGSIKCQLTQLNLVMIDRNISSTCCNNLLEFLKNQAKTVEELKLGWGTPRSVYELVFSKFEKLKSLHLVISEIPQENEFYKRLKPNKSITQLYILGSKIREFETQRSESITEFLRLTPNVTDLTLSTCHSVEILEIIANKLENLRRFIFDGFFNRKYSGIRFSCLKTFHTLNFDDEFDWKEFTKLNPHITELIIGGSYSSQLLQTDFVHRLLQTLKSNLSLQILRIEKHFPVDDRAYNILLEFTDLKIISLNERCALEKHLMSSLPGLFFHNAETTFFKTNNLAQFRNHYENSYNYDWSR
ncbi:hypothetical protein Bhyg_09273, partial [Pseudolycoriella hygida]